MELPFEDEKSMEPLRSEIRRAKTSLRMNYEAQVQVIQKQLGSLDEIREKMGLSQRKISQLLMIDPSSWTRWTRAGDQAPPHIWRALQWYMALHEKVPGLTPQYFLGRDPQIFQEKTLKMIADERKEREEQLFQLEDHLKRVEDENERLRRQQGLLFFALVSVSLFGLWGVLSSFLQ